LKLPLENPDSPTSAWTRLNRKSCCTRRSCERTKIIDKEYGIIHFDSIKETDALLYQKKRNSNPLVSAISLVYKKGNIITEEVTEKTEDITDDKPQISSKNYRVYTRINY
jgi:hypothetical protein